MHINAHPYRVFTAHSTTPSLGWMNGPCLGLGSMVHSMNPSFLVVGVSLAFALRPYQLSYRQIKYFSFPGELLMRMLQMLVLPLIVSSLVTGKSLSHCASPGHTQSPILRKGPGLLQSWEPVPDSLIKAMPRSCLCPAVTWSMHPNYFLVFFSPKWHTILPELSFFWREKKDWRSRNGSCYMG